MEKRIRDYERFIKEKLDSNPAKEELEKLSKYHAQMVMNFQHERLIHLLVTLFFVAITLAFSGVIVFMICTYSTKFDYAPVYYILTAILFILSFFYVKHYYFLENHIQKLYDYNERLLNL